MFAHKTIVITGGSQGFGKALAAAFAQEGAAVVISSSDEAGLHATAKELEVDAYAADVTSLEQMKRLAEYALKKHGRIDIWINNAGIQIAPSNVEDVVIAKLHRLFDVNFFGYFYGCKVIVPILRKQNSGAIMNINSTAGLGGKPGLSAYVSSKFALKGLTQSLREELSGTPIRVYDVFPGGMQTDIYKEKYPADFDAYMPVAYAVQKVMENLKSDQPELDLVIRRPAQS